MYLNVLSGYYITGWLHDQNTRPSFTALSNSLDMMLNDPARYIVTAVSNPSCVLITDAFVAAMSNVCAISNG